MLSKPTLISAFCALLLTAGGAFAAEKPTAPDVFTAVTTAMQPNHVDLRMVVREWSDEQKRKSVVAALEGGETATELPKLPTLGYVWTKGSPVGYSIKYAERVATADGEHVVFVTDRRLGSYDRTGWAANGGPPESLLTYSVITLDLNKEGHGVGRLSLSAEPIIDGSTGSVDLADSALPLLEDVTLEPKPYWANPS